MTGRIVFFAMVSFIQPFCFWAAAAAQDAPPGDGIRQAVVADARYTPASSVEHQSGEVGIVVSGAGYSYEFRCGGQLPVTLSLATRYIGIDNSSPVDVPARLAGTSFDVETTLPLPGVPRAYVRLGVTSSLLGDSWDYVTSDFRVSSRTVLVYKPSDEWMFATGVAFFPEFEREVIPVFGFIYKPDSAWLFHLSAPRPHIDYRFSDRWTLFAEGGLLGNEYEVTRGGVKTAVLKYQEVHAGLGVHYNIDSGLGVSVSAGRLFGRALQYRDGQGKVSIEDAYYAGLRLRARF